MVSFNDVSNKILIAIGIGLVAFVILFFFLWNRSSKVTEKDIDHSKVIKGIDHIIHNLQPPSGVGPVEPPVESYCGGGEGYYSGY